jgi:adenylate cyclase
MASGASPQLTERQLEVLELLAKGLTNADIARVLGIARATAKNHVSAVLQALDVANRTEAVGMLEQLGLRESREEAAVPGFGRRPAIAVLPFDDFGAGGEQRVFADGLAEDLITRLAAWRWFPVTARNSTFACREDGRAVDVARVGRELGARYVVEGSSRRAGDRVRVTAQLIDAETGSHVWADRYDRDVADVFSLQDEIVEAIVAALAPVLARVERLRATRLATPDLGAWESLQRGLHHYYLFVEDEIRQGRVLFERAVQLDPAFAPAFTAIALSHTADAMLGYGGDPAGSMGRALDAARRAVALDPLDAAAHTALGGALALLRQLREGQLALERALELDPSSALASFAYGMTVLSLEQAETSVDSFRRALRLSPLDPMRHDFEGALSVACYLAGRYEDSIAMAVRSMASRGDAGFAYDPVIAASLARMGRDEEARAAAEELRRRFPGASLESARVFASDEVIDHLREGLAMAGFEV